MSLKNKPKKSKTPPANKSCSKHSQKAQQTQLYRKFQKASTGRQIEIVIKLLVTSLHDYLFTSCFYDTFDSCCNSVLPIPVLLPVYSLTELTTCAGQSGELTPYKHSHRGTETRSSVTLPRDKEQTWNAFNTEQHLLESLSLLPSSYLKLNSKISSLLEKYSFSKLLTLT